jgi:glycosyltransferase involved in cell wall biosynthesis
VSAPLAIVIPAFKLRFLDATLQSIAAQTCHDFVLYVGDDASPEDIAAICRRWQGRIELHHTRFEHNLGGQDLVAHWRRCMALSNEPWVWLFSDDDLMPPDGVARLLAAVRAEGEQRDLFHFDVQRIDAQGQLLRQEPRFPALLGAREFALRRLRFELSSFVADYVFKRSALDALGGFVSFPRAWCADDATWISLAARGGIRSLAGAPVSWRESGENISARHDVDAAQKLRAQIDFVAWLDQFVRQHPAARGEPDNRALLSSARRWLFRQAKFLDLRFVPSLAAQTVAGLRHVPGFSPPRLWANMLLSDLRRANRQRRRR